jgi:adenine-specific DNA-methyltransferase
VKGKELKTIARALRRRQTETENRVWHLLRSRALLGDKFRRQQPIGPYIADFCCLARKLIIELDGGRHAAQEVHDRRRSEFLEREGFKVIRFWDHEVFANTDSVLETILTHLESPSPQPSPLKGEGVRTTVPNIPS